MGVQQKLMRHAHISTTMDQYGNASAIAKRKANRPIVQRVLRREMSQQNLDSIIKGNCEPVPLIGQFWTVATNAKLPVTV